MTQQMPGKLIALVDASIYARSVCEHAAWVATRTGWDVELMHVLGRREAAERTDLSGAIALGARSALLAELAELDAQRARLMASRGRAILEDAKTIVEQAVAAAAPDAAPPVTTRLRHGDIVDTLTEQEAGAEMVMIGKRGEAADFAKGHLGSNLERIARAVHKPVFVASRAFRPIARVVIAFDGGLSSTRAVEHVARCPLYAGLAVHVVTVGAPSATLRAGIEDARAMLAGAGLAATAGVIEGQPEKALGEFVEAEGFDMLVMGAYGHSRIRSLIIGSTTTEMIRSCKVPVVLIR